MKIIKINDNLKINIEMLYSLEKHNNKKYIEIDSLDDVRSPIKNKDEFEILVLIKIFLICHT